MRIGLPDRMARPPSLVARIAESFFMALLLAAGLFFGGLIIRDVSAKAATRLWHQTPCRIVASEAHEKRDDKYTGKPYTFSVAYTYELDGTAYTSSTYRRDYDGTADFAEAEALALKYPVGSQQTCYVDLANPAQAVLAHASLLIGVFIVLPAIALVLGGCGLVAAWRPRRAPSHSLTERKQPSKGTLVGALFFSVFLLAGAGFFYGLFLRPAAQLIDARQWLKTPCVVLSSRVLSHSDGDGTTHSIDILYRYQVAGTTHRSNRYDFTPASSSGRRRKQTVVDRYPQGTRTFCYVDPDDPTEAVLSRSFPLSMLYGLLPLVFILIGGGGLAFLAVAALKPDAVGNTHPWLSNQAAALLDADPDALGPATLRPETSRRLHVVGRAILALGWNGGVAVFVAHCVDGWLQGRGNWLITVFLLPFVGIGIWLIIALVGRILALFSPRPAITVCPPAPRPGDTLDVQWTLLGCSDTIQHLTLALEAREEATYSRGTDSVTDKHTFFTLTIADTADHYEMLSGHAQVAIPPDTMHSFESDHNKIVWTFTVHADIPRWPDVDEEFPLCVLPQAATPGDAT